MSDITLISLDDFKKGLLRGASTLEHTRDVAEGFLSAAIRGIVPEILNDIGAVETLLEIFRNHRSREDHRSTENSNDLTAFTPYHELFGEEQLDLIIDDATALALIAGLASDGRYQNNYSPNREQDTVDYRKAVKIFHDQVLGFYRISAHDLFEYAGKLSSDMTDLWNTWFKADDDEYFQLYNVHAPISFIMDKASDAANGLDTKYPGPFYLFNDPAHHPGYPFEYRDDSDKGYELTHSDKITAYVRINLVMNRALRLIWENRDIPLDDIINRSQELSDPNNENESTVGTHEKSIDIDGCLYIGDPPAYDYKDRYGTGDK